MSLTALEALDRSWQPARSVELDDLRLQVDRVERRSLAGCRLHNLGSGQQAAAGPRWRGGSARIVSANELSCSERATMCSTARRRTCTRTAVATSAMTGLGRERLSPWYDVGYVFVCVCVCTLEWVPRV